MIEYEKNGNVATITFNRPEKLNAMSLLMYDALGDAYCQARDDDDVRVVVLTSKSERAFCVGADMTESIPALAEGRFDISQWDAAHIKDIGMYKPVISAIRGLCIGGGFEFILSTDIRIAAIDAVFQLPEPRHGFVPAGGTLARLTRQISYSHAMQIMLMAEPHTAADIYRMGIINEVLPSEQVLPRAYEIAQGIAELAPIAIQTIKEATLTLQTEPLEQAFKKEAILGQKTFTCDEAKAGLANFMARSNKMKGKAHDIR